MVVSLQPDHLRRLAIASRDRLGQQMSGMPSMLLGVSRGRCASGIPCQGINVLMLWSAAM
jgi:hypothetical protein